MADLTNPTSLPGGYKNGQQAPLDGKVYFENEADLLDVSDDRPLGWYKEMMAVDRTTGEIYIWRPSKDGLIPSAYRYPADVVSFGYDYSLQTFNWVNFKSVIGIVDPFENKDVEIVNTPLGNVLIYNGYNATTGKHEIKSILKLYVPGKGEVGHFILSNSGNGNIVQAALVSNDLKLESDGIKIQISTENLIRDLGSEEVNGEIGESVYYGYDSVRHIFRGIKGSSRIFVSRSPDDRNLIISDRKAISLDGSLEITEKEEKGEQVLDYKVNFPSSEAIAIKNTTFLTDQGANVGGELTFEEVGKQGIEFQPAIKLGTLRGSQVFDLPESNTDNKFTTGLETKKFYNLYYPAEIRDLNVDVENLSVGDLITVPSGNKNIDAISVTEKEDKKITLSIDFTNNVDAKHYYSNIVLNQLNDSLTSFKIRQKGDNGLLVMFFSLDEGNLTNFNFDCLLEYSKI